MTSKVLFSLDVEEFDIPEEYGQKGKLVELIEQTIDHRMIAMPSRKTEQQPLDVSNPKAMLSLALQ